MSFCYNVAETDSGFLHGATEQGVRLFSPGAWVFSGRTCLLPRPRDVPARSVGVPAPPQWEGLWGWGRGAAADGGRPLQGESALHPELRGEGGLPDLTAHTLPWVITKWESSSTKTAKEAKGKVEDINFTAPGAVSIFKPFRRKTFSEVLQTGSKS